MEEIIDIHGFKRQIPSREEIRAEVIDEMVLKLETNMPSKLDEKERYGYTVALSILLEQLEGVEE